MARMAIVVGAMVLGVIASHFVILAQIGFGLSFGALIAVSFGTVYAVPIAAVNFAVAAIWLIPYSPRLRRVHHWIVFANRQIGHLAFFLVWTVIALARKPLPHVQLPLVTALYLFGERLVDAVARALDPNAAQATAADFLWIRRPVFYLGTILGAVVLVALAPEQVGRIVPLFFAIGIGTATRILKIFTRHLESRSNRFSSEADRVAFRQEHASVYARQHDKWLPRALVMAIVLFVPVGALFRHHTDVQAPTPGHPGEVTCRRETGGPVGQPDLGLFIVSDTQLHELRGPRYEGQVDLMGAFVPVAVRPVELDTLSAPTFLHFRDIYREIQAGWRGGTPVAWTHLGDFADSGCVGELERFERLFQAFAAVGPLAGIAPGNHDSAFTGNFGWHPDWDVACPSGHLDKTTSDQQLDDMLNRVARGGQARRLPIKSEHWWDWWFGRQTAFPTVTPLGVAHDRWGERGVIAVFLDTSDRLRSDLLIAGSRGTVSSDQVARVQDAISTLQRELGGPYQNHPAFLVLFHHPLAEMTGSGRAAILNLGAFLDGSAQAGVGPHLLGFISAHTHVSDGRFACVGARQVRELVVGSTIDPPQEAALLTLGSDWLGHLALRLRTIQSVERSGASCGDSTAPSGPECKELVGDLANYRECQSLTTGPAGSSTAAQPCSSLEKIPTLAERVRAVARERNDESPAALREAQWNQADTLLACVCRATGCTPPADALDERRSGQVLDAIFDPPEAPLAGEPKGEQAAKNQKIVACLSWAAAAVQLYKANGMQMEDGLRCAFDDALLAPAKEFVATLTPDATGKDAFGSYSCR